MMRVLWLCLLVLSMRATGSAMSQCTSRCVTPGATLLCDKVCTTASCLGASSDNCKTCNGGAHVGESCPNDAYCGGANHCVVDGTVTICAADLVQAIAGTTNDDLICYGQKGSGVTIKSIDAKAGNDDVAPYQVTDGSGNPENNLAGTWASMRISGGNGNDLLVGADSDDVIYGDAGDDIIVGGAGHDILHGGDGDDLLTINTYGTNFPPDTQTTGSVMCGDADDDMLIADGPGHQCMDGGAGTADDCSYGFSTTPSRSAVVTDTGTFRHCETTTGTQNSEPCGCETTLPTD